MQSPIQAVPAVKQPPSQAAPQASSPPGKQPPRQAAAAKAGEGQGPAVAGGMLSLLGPEAAVGRDYWDLDLFMSISHFEGAYKQHNAALKYFRKIAERNGSEGLRFSTSRKAAVAAIIHPPGMSYDFDEDDLREWSWWELVAQLNGASLACVVEDGDNSRGLVACEFRPRPNSYDHKRHHEKRTAGKPEEDAQLRVWDFVLIRSDQSAVRLHPQWSTPKVETYDAKGHGAPVEIQSKWIGEV